MVIAFRLRLFLRVLPVGFTVLVLSNLEAPRFVSSIWCLPPWFCVLSFRMFGNFLFGIWLHNE